MDKLGKFILTGAILIAIAVPLAFIIGHNARARMDKFAQQGVDVGLGLNTLGAIDNAREAVSSTNQTNQEITQMIEGTSTATSTE